MVLRRAVLRVPVALQIADQRRAEVAISLFARIDGEIGAESIKRLLRDANRAPVARSADHAGIGQSIDHALEGGVHLAGADDLVADQPAFRTVAVEPPLVQNRLPRDAVAGEAGHAHVGGTGVDALLARR